MANHYGCAPDLVYRNRTTGELVIVERKASDKPIPVNGWPNLRAQLWAYSHIDNFKSAPTISLIGEVWDMVEGRLTRRAVLRWAQADKEFDAENMELFSLYGVFECITRRSTSLLSVAGRCAIKPRSAD
jgi:hypothetical protein